MNYEAPEMVLIGKAESVVQNNDKGDEQVCDNLTGAPGFPDNAYELDD